MVGEVFIVQDGSLSGLVLSTGGCYCHANREGPEKAGSGVASNVAEEWHGASRIRRSERLASVWRQQSGGGHNGWHHCAQAAHSLLSGESSSDDRGQRKGCRLSASVSTVIV